MRLAELIHGLSVRPVATAGGPSGGPPLPDSVHWEQVRICDLTEDSRTALPGSLFIARRGEKNDGRTFIKPAIDAGAVAVLTDDPSLTLPPLHAGHHAVVLLLTDNLPRMSAAMAERFYGSPSSKLTLIGITGTKGKTTTAFLIHQILNALGVRTGLIGTVCIDDGVEVSPAVLTTPMALELSCMMGRMVEAGCQACVMEVSSHALHQHRVGALQFRAGVFTNLSGDHLDYHKTMDHYAASKAMLFESLPADGSAIVNAADPAHLRMVKDCRARILPCMLGAGTEGGGWDGCAAKVIQTGPAWTDVEFTGPWGHTAARVPLVGEFNVMNALEAAAAVHSVFGGTGEDDVSFATIAEALSRVTAPPGRLQNVTDDRSPITVLVDYAHTDDALKNVLVTLRRSMERRAADGGAPGQLWCVFGCGGDRDRSKRPRMGKVAADLADQIVVTSDNPRTENPDSIIAEILKGVPAESQPRVIVEPDREKAILRAIAAAKPGDVLIIAGKGHETYQILPDPKKPGATITRDFDDRLVAREGLKRRGIVLPEPLRCPPEEEDADDDQEGAASAPAPADKSPRRG